MGGPKRAPYCLMFAKANYFFVAFSSLFFVAFASAQIAPPPGRGLGGTQTTQPPPQQVGIVAIPQGGRRENKEPSVSRRDKKLIEPDATDIAKFQTLLNKSGYGIAKLLNSKCPAEATNVYLVSADDGCANSLPGNGAHFSFRRREHIAPVYADIKIKDGKFIVGSFFTQGLIVSLGEIGVEEIGLNTAGVKYLAAFEPAKDRDGAQKQTAEITRGRTDDSYFYSGSAEIKENQAFVLRSVAYRTGSETGDKRRDVIIAFQVVRQDDEGNVTLIWKELQNKESPKLDQEK